MTSVVPAKILDIRNLTVVYRSPKSRIFKRDLNTIAVKNANIHVDAGEFVGIVGESGSGKSTIAQVVTGFIRPTEGEVYLCGKDLFRLRGKSRRMARIEAQLIFQDPVGSLDPRQSVESALNEIRALHSERSHWIGNEALLASVGLEARILARYPHQLSGGQAQRIAIARAILLRPAMLIADEATSALDVSVQAQILDLLKSLSREYGIAVLLISHDLAVVRQTCNRVYVIYRGNVVEEGNTESIMNNPRHEYTKRLIDAAFNKGRHFMLATASEG